MFWNKNKNKEADDTGSRLLDNAITRLEEGDKTCLHLVYYVFAYGDSELARRGGRAIGNLLKTYSMQQMIRLSEIFRQYTSLEWYIDWDRINLQNIKSEFEKESDYLYALILGSFHPNGYFRERCLFLMAEYDGTLPFLVLRMNDWVANIRDRAYRLVLEKIDTCCLSELFLSSQALVKVERSGRRCGKDLGALEKKIREKIKKDIGTFPLWRISRYEFNVRKSIYMLLFSEKILDISQADRLLNLEKHSFCQSVIISGILRDYDCATEKIDSYLTHKNSSVRRKALEYKYKLLKMDWPGLESLLLDKSRGIRDLTAFILEKYRVMDIPGFYISHLGDENPVVPILGLGETGDKSQAGELYRFLCHPSGKVVSSAILSIGRLSKMDGEELYWKYLFDERIPVSKACCQTIINAGIHCGAERLYTEYTSWGITHVRRYLIRLLLHENTWERLPYLIYLYREKGEDRMGDKLLESMGKRNVYAKVPEGLARQIIQALEESGDLLPEQLRKDILFDLKFVKVK